MHRYKMWNGPMPTTAAQAAVATGTVIKTMLQVATPSTRQIQLISWGYATQTTPASGISIVELLQTDVAATVTAASLTGVISLDPNAPSSLMTLGTGATGFTGTAEGAITATRVFDVVEIAPTSGAYQSWYSYQWMPDERPIIAASRFLRVRATFATSVNMVCWVVWDE